jgi:hypothetical protein
MLSPIHYTYLVSTSYAGSTLLCMLLNAHSQVASVGELSNSIGEYIKIGRFDEYLCSCGVEIKRCPFWSEIKKRCAEKNVQLDLHNFDTNLDVGLGPTVNQHLDARLGYYVNHLLFDVAGKAPFIFRLRSPLLPLIPAYRRVINRVIPRKVTIAETILEHTGKTVFLDGSKGLDQAVQLNRCRAVDFKLIHLVRDPRGFVNSFRKRRGDQCLRERAKHWVWINRAVLRTLKPRLSEDSYLLVHYEKLCQDTAGTLADICRFLGLQPEDLLPRVNQSAHHIIGNNMRLKPFQGLRLDRSWEQDLTAEQLAECARVTGELAAEMGYELG